MDHPRPGDPQEPPQLFGVTIIPPAVGMAPEPPAEIVATVDILEVIHAGPRTRSDQLQTALGTLVRRAVVALAGKRFRPHAHGLSARETEQWAQQAAPLLSAAARAKLLEYARACQDWTRALHSAIGSNKADPDWDMTSARNVEPSAPEAFLARSLAAAGIPVQAQVGVAKERGGRRRGGWYGAFWLDCAHRDAAYLLRVDIELDGRHHYRQERQARDQERNQILADRGWYVVRLSGRIIGQANHHQALDRLVAVVERHRRAIVLGRSDLSTLARVLASSPTGNLL
jgi:hypothetical protein